MRLLLLGIAMSVREMWAHKFRSFLTMLGLIFGVACLTTTFALVAGMEKGLREDLYSHGGVERVSIIKQKPPPEQADLAWLSPGQTYEDAQAIMETCPLIRDVAPGLDITPSSVTRQNKTARASWVRGTTSSMLDAYNLQMVEGRFINELDVERQQKVCALGITLRDELFGEDVSALGQIVYVRSEPLEVVGVFKTFESESARKWKAWFKNKKVMEKEKQRRSGFTGTSRWDSRNRAFYLPITTVQNYFKNTVTNQTLDAFATKVVHFDKLDPALDQMRNTLLRTHRGIEDFGFHTQEDHISDIEETIRQMKQTGGLIAGISLLVAGIGIVNIMLASIQERIRELGIRRAIGAGRRDIFIQILIESLTLSALGGFVGLLAAVPLTELLASLAPESSAPILDLGPMITSFSFALLVGILAGLFPALRAARLDPIAALRFE